MTSISFCTPIMNRIDDLRRTLPVNIKNIEKFAPQCELVIGCFDDGDDCREFIFNKFSAAIKSGVLRFHQFMPLDFWHFCDAKNSFSELELKEFYFSLDGDGYVTERQIEAALNVLTTTQGTAVLHGFSGEWGDGTSGRICVPSEIYRAVQYSSCFFPRQFDEMSLLIGAFLARSDCKLICNGPDADIVRRERNLLGFLERKDSVPEVLYVDLGEKPLADNPRGPDYVEQDEQLRLQQMFNSRLFYAQNEDDPVHRRRSENSLRAVQRKIVTGAEAFPLAKYVFGPEVLGREPESLTTVYCVAKDDHLFLPDWLAHYRAIGVERFVIIDDGSDPPLGEFVSADDCIFLSPRIGDFKRAKVFWIELALRVLQSPGSWAITVDADEFLDIKTTGSLTSLNLLIDYCNWSGAPVALGVLVDLLPEKGLTDQSSDDFTRTFTHCLLREGEKDFGYSNEPSVRGMGKHWRRGFAVDLRYRCFSTLDSVVKYPIFKYDVSIKLNQGFHSLSFGEKRLNPEENFEEYITLPVKHYKFAKYSDNLKSNNQLSTKNTHMYYDRTRENFQVQNFFGVSHLNKIWNLTQESTEFGEHIFAVLNRSTTESQLWSQLWRRSNFELTLEAGEITDPASVVSPSVDKSTEAFRKLVELDHQYMSRILENPMRLQLGPNDDVQGRALKALAIKGVDVVQKVGAGPCFLGAISLPFLRELIMEISRKPVTFRVRIDFRELASVASACLKHRKYVKDIVAIATRVHLALFEARRLDIPVLVESTNETGGPTDLCVQESLNCMYKFAKSPDSDERFLAERLQAMFDELKKCKGGPVNPPKSPSQ